MKQLEKHKFYWLARVILILIFFMLMNNDVNSQYLFQRDTIFRINLGDLNLKNKICFHLKHKDIRIILNRKEILNRIHEEEKNVLNDTNEEKYLKGYLRNKNEIWYSKVDNSLRPFLENVLGDLILESKVEIFLNKKRIYKVTVVEQRESIDSGYVLYHKFLIKDLILFAIPMGIVIE